MTTEDLYPSRTVARAGLSPRRDPVVHGKPETGLTLYQRQTYEANGYLLVEDLLTPTEVTTLLEEVDRLRSTEDLRGREEVIREPSNDTVRSVFSVHRFSQALGAVARHPRVLAMVDEIVGGEAYLHQTRVNYKPGLDGKEFFWHSDFETWHVEDGMPRMRAVSAVISLTDNHQQNGPLMIIPGSHQWFLACVGETPPEHYKQSLRRQDYGVPDGPSLEELTRRADGRIDALTGRAGSLVLFDSNCTHGSNSNITPFPRTNLFFVYNSVENALVEPFCGLEPRPEHIAARGEIDVLVPA